MRRYEYDLDERYGVKIEHDKSGKPVLSPIGDLRAIIETPDWHVPESREVERHAAVERGDASGGRAGD